MPIYDLQCTIDSTHQQPDWIAQTFSEPLPSCPICGSPQEKVWSTAFGHKPFDAFTFDADGIPIHIDSLSKLREVEKNSMKNYEAGIGRPFIFRHYSQDRSNRDQGVFGRMPEDAKFTPDSRKIKALRGRRD